MSTITLAAPIDLRDTFAYAPPALDFLLPNYVAGTVGALVAPGGAGKSMLALGVSLQIACGIDVLGVGELAQGRVTYLAAEDPVGALRLRLHAMGKHLTQEHQLRTEGNLRLIPLVGCSPDLLRQEWRDALMRAADGQRLLILDTLRRFHTSDENISGQMAELLGHLECIATSTGSAVMYLHHAGKGAVLGGASDTAQAARGSSVLIDNARWAGYLCQMSEAEAKSCGVAESQRAYYVRFGVAKANYGQPFAPVWLRRHEGGVLLPATDIHAADVQKRATRGGMRRAAA